MKIYIYCIVYSCTLTAGETVQCFNRENFQKNGIMFDNIDGREYYEFIKKVTQVVADNVRIITLTLNTDGIGFFESTKKSVWPYMLVINELHKECR